MVSHEDEPTTDEETDESIRERMARDAAIRMSCWLALGKDPEDAPCDVSHACERRYYEPDIDWPEDEDSAAFEEAEAAHSEWYFERARMFWNLVVHKATDVVDEHYEALERVAVALCYQGTLSGSQVAQIVERVKGDDRRAA